MPENPNSIVTSGRHHHENPSSERFYLLSNIWAILKNLGLILTGSYGLSQSIHIILRYMVGERSTLVAFFNNFAHVMWMPALILLPFMLLFKQKRIAATLLLPAVLFIGNYGVMFMPRTIAAPPTGEHHLTIQTHNLLANNRTPERIPGIIQDISADIVALQEVSIEYAQMLEPLDEYPYKAIHGKVDNATERRTMGQAVLSKYPILEDTYWTYDFAEIPLGNQRVVIDVDGQLIVVYNVHPTHPGMTGHAFFDHRQRGKEIADILQRIESETLPVLLMGDFNMPDLSDDYSVITSHLVDTFRSVGHGMGFSFPDLHEARITDSVQFMPDNSPDHLSTPLFMRLDYVFHSEEFVGLHAYIYHTSGGSDHRPLIVELALLDSA